MFYAYPIGWVECNISILKNVIFIHEKFVTKQIHKLLRRLLTANFEYVPVGK